MKLLQFNILSLNTSLEELWGYQKENNYDAIFLQETNYTVGKPIAYFKHCKTKMFTNFQNKAMGFAVGPPVSSVHKNVFQEDIWHKDLEIIWNGMQIQGNKTLVGNIYIPLVNKNHLHILDMELENTRLLIGVFNSRKKTWDRNANHNNKMGLRLEGIINRHDFYITANTDFTDQQSTMASNSGKSTTDLTLTRGLKNTKVVTKDFTLIKTRHEAIEIQMEQEPLFKPNPKFQNNADWEK